MQHKDALASDPMLPTLFALGYEGLTIGAFIARLQTAQVKTVVDVRELPLSRKKEVFKVGFLCRLVSPWRGLSARPRTELPQVHPQPIQSNWQLATGNWQIYTRDFLKPVGRANGDAPDR